MMSKVIIDYTEFLSNKREKSLNCFAIYWVLYTLIDKRSNTFQLLSKVSDSLLTAMMLVFLVCAQRIDKYY